ncbi:hypothetical protein PHYBOEH_005693 [Phytophthora boehmeriae]|uniref:Ubiquitin carboxyl-terminal hydrolase and/or F-box protein n=1 Tax=Phytophthora boehmeriae TaxID=109152 RepID=A0A8T1XFP5_9STRA|nr:hypothetical protein PHYBOEH_005693 [Phytophthora boehmeriae]
MRRPMASSSPQRLGVCSASNSEICSRLQHPRLAQCLASEGSAGETDSESLDLDADDVDMDEQMDKTQPRHVQTLPDELLALVLAQLDGQSLLASAATCRALRALTFQRDVWKRLCLRQWPTLRTQLLPQLPGAPDYDLVRLYGGCWRRCFLEKHKKNQRTEISVKIPRFASIEDMQGVDKVVSDTFSIGDHRFCLWIFPNGNPNEAQYKGRVLSVYLVLTDLAERAPNWLTCAVFSLQVENALDPRRRLEWHSCLTDNKFHRQLNNWGVHSLGSLSMLRDPQQGFLTSSEGQSQPDTLTVSAQVRLMTITFRVVFEHDLRHHHGLGLVNFTSVAELELPFCCSLHDLVAALHYRFPDVLGTFKIDEAADTTRVWCFNQPVVSGQALRPRKLLKCTKEEQDQPLFGRLLCDGVDIDAYSFCQIYVESDTVENNPLLDQLQGSLVDEKSLLTATSSTPGGYVFVKLLRPAPINRLEYLGKVRFPELLSDTMVIQEKSDSRLPPSVVYEAVARHTGWSCAQLDMYREEIAPTVISKSIPYHASAASAGLQPADIVVFVVREQTLHGLSPLQPMHNLLLDQYEQAWQLSHSSSLEPLTLEQVENLAEKLDIPKFRVRSAFRKCHEDASATLRYIMEGRHLGFICDSCGETDFTGARFNCAVCTDYDLCATCNAQSCDISHRYANVDGKWQRVYNFKDHKGCHAMREMLPVFYEYGNRQHQQQASNGYCKW